MHHDLPFQPGHAARRAPLVHGLATGLFRLCTLGLLAAGATIHPVARTPWVSGRVTGSPYPPAPYKAEQVHTGLAFENPLDIALAPGTGRLFIAEQGGRIWSFDTRSEHAKPDLALDLRKHRQQFDSVLGFTFHPGFQTNRYVFINYNEPGNRPDGARVSRFTVTAMTPPVIDPATEHVIIRWPAGGHNGCALAFGPDGYLYISTGDGDDPDPPDGKRKTGQDITDLLGGILRIDPDHPQGTNHYGIPSDNPFLKVPGARPEVWAFGMRNPFRMSFAPDGALWVGDVGFDQWEMIYRVKSGGNYGWSITEGPNPRVRTDVKPGPGPILPPMTSHPHSEAASITGGRFYNGQRLPKLRGAYVYGDWETGKFWALRNDGDKLLSDEELCDTTLKPISFATDPDGELVILDYRGGLHRLSPNDAPPANTAFPKRLSETGVFLDLPRLAPSEGVVTYRPTAPMWSDFATAERHLAVPGTNPVVTADGRQTIAGRMWDWPVDSVLTRTLTLEMERGKPATRRRVETQLLHFDGQAWNGYTFAWNKEQTDADLVPPGGASTTFTVADPAVPGGRREIPWRFLGRTECMRCHQCWSSDTLSFNWLQLGSLPPSDKSEFRRLTDLGILQIKSPPKPEEWQELVDPYDAGRPLEARARSWLHVNCAGCHRFNGGGSVPLMLSYDRKSSDMRAIDERPTRGHFDLVDARIIAPGDPYRSTLYYRIGSEGSGHMPHIGSRLTDESGWSVIRAWIRSLPAKPAGPGVSSLNQTIATALHQGDVASLLSTMNGALALASSPDDSRRPAAASAAASHTNAMIREFLQRLLPPEQRRHTLGADVRPETILALQGEPERGRELFAGVSQCSRCHAMQGTGRAYGPDLVAAARKYDRRTLLDQILQPSKIIAPEYKSVTWVLRDETELTGFVVRRSATEWILRDENLAEHTIKPSAVREQIESQASAMPDGLLAPLTAQEAADLLAYLMSASGTGSPAKP